MSPRSTLRQTSFVFALAFVGLDPNYLTQGGAPAPIWLAGAVVHSAAVSANRVCGRGADHQPAPCADQIATTGPADELGTDASKPVRMTWGCGGELEWREAETASLRLTARTLVVCGTHELKAGEVRLTIRAHELILRDATITTQADGFFDVRTNSLKLEGESKIVTRAPASAQPPFSSSANISLSAAAVIGTGRLLVQTWGADFLAE
jgi:hypothetical protein